MAMWNVHIQRPNMLHDHWGIMLHKELKAQGGSYFFVREFDDGEPVIEHGCNLASKIERKSKDLGYQPFHQGGHHTSFEDCGSWHYIEFWGMPSDSDYFQVLINFIESLKETN